MPSGNFTDRYVIMECSNCGKKIQLTQGQYNFRSKRSHNIFCSKECKDESNIKPDIRDVLLICSCCEKDFTKKPTKYNYNKKRKKVEYGEKVFCSVKCATKIKDPETIKLISDKQKGVSVPSRGRHGVELSEEHKKKLSIAAKNRAGNGSGLVNLVCANCNKQFQRKRWQWKRDSRIGKGRGPFCSNICSLVGRPVSDKTKEKLRKSQIYIPKPQSGIIGHPISKETKQKISETKTGISIKPDWDIVDTEMKRRGIIKYAITREPIPDTIFIENEKLVALELQKNRYESSVRTKMRLYDNCRSHYDKVIIVWYNTDGKFMKEWVKENGEWKQII